MFSSSSKSFRSVAAFLASFVMAIPSSILVTPAQSATSAQVRGVLLNADGTPAVGFQLGLKNEAGDLFLSPATLADGSFAIDVVPPGSYRLVAFGPDGAEFPVLGQQVELKAGQVERSEVRLGGRATPAGTSGKAAAGKSKKAGWGIFGMSTGGSVAVIAVVVGGAFALASGGDNKNDNSNPSPSTPARR